MSKNTVITWKNHENLPESLFIARTSVTHAKSFENAFLETFLFNQVKACLMYTAKIVSVSSWTNWFIRRNWLSDSFVTFRLTASFKDYPGVYNPNMYSKDTNHCKDFLKMVKNFSMKPINKIHTKLIFIRTPRTLFKKCTHWVFFIFHGIGSINYEKVNWFYLWKTKTSNLLLFFPCLIFPALLISVLVSFSE